MPKIKNKIKVICSPERNMDLGKVHDAYNKHAPTINIGYIDWMGERFNQYACPCGCKFYEAIGERDDQAKTRQDMPQHHGTYPGTAWGKMVGSFYGKAGLGEAFIDFILSEIDKKILEGEDRKLVVNGAWRHISKYMVGAGIRPYNSVYWWKTRWRWFKT